MVYLPNIPCLKENHRKMPFQYACLHSGCRDHRKELACLYCMQEFHQSHMSEILPIKQLLNELDNKREGTQFNVLKLLLNGIETCRTYQQLRTNFTELMDFRANPKRFQKLVDEEMQNIQISTRNYYKRTIQKQLTNSSSNKQAYLIKPFITPILTFKEGEHYQLDSPFCITATKHQELITVFAHPNLTKLHDSIDIKVKINRQTPSWLGIGLSSGQSKFQEKSNKHILAISNGWISNKGVLQQSRLRFSGGDQLQLKWNKSTQILQLICRKQKITLKMQSIWKQQIYLCVCLFYKGDSVSLFA